MQNLTSAGDRDEQTRELAGPAQGAAYTAVRTAVAVRAEPPTRLREPLPRVIISAVSLAVIGERWCEIRRVRSRLPDRGSAGQFRAYCAYCVPMARTQWIPSNSPGFMRSAIGRAPARAGLHSNAPRGRPGQAPGALASTPTSTSEGTPLTRHWPGTGQENCFLSRGTLGPGSLYGTVTNSPEGTGNPWGVRTTGSGRIRGRRSCRFGHARLTPAYLLERRSPRSL
jgi:hypothetical protein